MSFVELLKTSKITKDCDEPLQESNLTEKQKLKPEDVLRKNGFKIKLVIPTAFGTQIDFFRKPDADDIEKTLEDFEFKIKNKSVFITN